MTVGVDTVPCPPIDEYQQLFLTKDATPITPTAARIVVGVHTTSVADQSRLIASLRADIANPPNGLTATPTGLAALATTAYDNLVSRAYLLNLAPLVLVGPRPPGDLPAAPASPPAAAPHGARRGLGATRPPAARASAR